MAVGQGQTVSPLSYVAVGRETTLGTAVTATSELCVLSSGLKATKPTKILEEICSSRTYKSQIKMGKVVEGELEFYFRPRNLACAYLMQNAFGGTITSATATGETAGGSALTHTFEIGAMDQSYTSLTINTRKGDSSNGKVFEYTGCRVQSMSFSAELDEAIKSSVSLMGIDATVGATDLESTFSFETASALSFVDGRLSVEASFSSLTSSSFWHVQGFNLTLNNSLKGDEGSRRIGSDLLTVLPPGVQTYEFSATVRFDTTTAFDAMIANTKLAAELEFLGDTLPTSVIREGLKLQMQHVRIDDAGDPELGGPDELLTSEVTFAVLQDDTSATGYALRALLTNVQSSYA